MSIAFFILAGKIKDALMVAIERMKDLNLAVLICWLVEGDDSPNLKDILEKHFIYEGKTCDDPWLVSMAHWWQKDYFKAINSIGSLIEDAKVQMSSKVFQETGFFNVFVKTLEISTSINERAPLGPE